jgi:sulfoxide reductase catalytic subunit YedY
MIYAYSSYSLFIGEVSIMHKIKSSEITSKKDYLSRREFLKGAGIVSASALILAACAGQPAAQASNPTSILPTSTLPESTPTAIKEPLTSYEAVTNYNNYYEFTIDKGRVVHLSKDFRSSPWEIKVGGLVSNPKTFDLDDLQKFTQEERIYRLRCVEGWSMVIPWMGFPLSKLLKEVEPNSSAKYVRFETLYDLEQYPGQKSDWYQWPYVEGLRIDEAMHDLTILATGLYGEPLPTQNGAPVRLVVPWKYGFKSIKAIVKIDLVEEMPTSLWMAAAPHEYGFYANVNPEVDHPRWSQSSERRIGESGRQRTLMFNGYEEEVAHLYAGMDLAKNY